ncbi:MAG: hypothetical protein ACKVTZ_03155 [Bacteroidia bacterium]
MMLKLTVTAKVLNDKILSYKIDHEKVLIADPAHRYYLTFNASAWSDDTVKIEFSPEGFLKRIETITDDKTGAIIEKLAELGTKIAEAAAMIPEFVDRDMVETKMMYTTVFDPFNLVEMQRVNQELAAINKSVSVEVRLIDVADIDDKKGVINFDKPVGGIYARPIASAELTMKAGTSIQRHLFTLPHPLKVHFVAMTRPRFIKSSFSMDFDMGFPKSIAVQRPSQLLSILQVPINVLSTILALPSKLIWGNGTPFQNNNNAANVATAQIQQQLDSQKSMLQLQQELSSLKTQQGNAGGGGQATRGGVGANTNRDTETRSLDKGSDEPREIPFYL